MIYQCFGVKIAALEDGKGWRTRKGSEVEEERRKEAQAFAFRCLRAMPEIRVWVKLTACA